ncbi:hypothetical protein WUBG_17642, partial [Wuchereria bancrofti]
IQSPVLEMDVADEPFHLIDIKGSCNCLFQSLAYYVAGAENDYCVLQESIIGFELEHPDEFIAIKNWTNDNWTCHISILAETGIGAELELYAFAAMFSIDVW